MSFVKRLAVFILILIGMILFWAIFPISARSGEAEVQRQCNLSAAVSCALGFEGVTPRLMGYTGPIKYPSLFADFDNAAGDVSTSRNFPQVEERFWGE